MKDLPEIVTGELPVESKEYREGIRNHLIRILPNNAFSGSENGRTWVAIDPEPTGMTKGIRFSSPVLAIIELDDVGKYGGAVRAYVAPPKKGRWPKKDEFQDPVNYSSIVVGQGFTDIGRIRLHH